MSRIIGSELRPDEGMVSPGQELEMNPEEKKDFILEKVPATNQKPEGDKGEGFVYCVFFPTQEGAEKAVRDFWNARKGSEMTRRSLVSGMLKPFDHEITNGDRTTPLRMSKHPEKPFMIQFNGNTAALSARGEAALREIGILE